MRGIDPAFIVALAVACLAGVVRVGVAANDPLWLDELHTAWCVDAAVPLDTAVERAAQGNQTPLFFGLEYLVVRLLGLSEFNLRLISVLSGSALAGLATAWVARTTRSLLAGALTGLVATVEPGLIFYATEARPFGLLQAIGLAQFLFFLEAVTKLTVASNMAEAWKRCGRFCYTLLKVWNRSHRATDDGDDPLGGRTRAPWRHRVGLLITSALIPWLHLTGVLLIIAQTLWCVLHLRSKAARHVLTTLALASLFAMPLFSLATGIAGHHADWSSVSDPRQVIADWGVLVALWGAVPLAGWLFSFVTLPPSARSIGPTPRRTIPVLLWCILIPPLALVVADTAFGIPVALSRYAQVAAGLLPLLPGLIVGQMVAGQARTWTAILALLLTFWMSPVVDTLLSQGRLPRMRHENWKATIALLNELASPNEPLYLFSNLVEDRRLAQFSDQPLSADDEAWFEYLRFPVRGIYRAKNREVFPRSTLVAPRFWPSDLQHAGFDGRKWMLVRGTPELVSAICREFQMTLGAHRAKPWRFTVHHLDASDLFLVAVNNDANNNNDVKVEEDSE